MHRRFCPQTFACAACPALVIDGDGNIADVNLACRELLGTAVAGCKHRHWTHLARQVATSAEGDLLPPAIEEWLARLSPHPDQPAAFGPLTPLASNCRFRSERYGLARLKTILLPCVEPDTGDCRGALAQFNLLQVEQEAAFHAALEVRWIHEVMWEIYAALYDRMLGQLPFYQEVRDLHLSAMSGSGFRRVLDIGAGTGNVTVPLLNQGQHVTAVDIGGAMVEKLLRKLDASAADRLTLIEDSAERLPQVATESADGVTILLALYDMQNPSAALAEAVRVLRPGGTLIITEPRAAFDVERLMKKAEHVFRSQEQFQRIQGDWNKILAIKSVLSQTIRRAQTPPTNSHASRPWCAETVVSMLQENGFAELTAQVSYEETCLTIRAIKSAPPAGRLRPQTTPDSQAARQAW